MDARGRLCFGTARHPRDQRPLGQRIDRGVIDFCSPLGHVTMEMVAGESANVPIPMAPERSPHAILTTTDSNCAMPYNNAT